MGRIICFISVAIFFSSCSMGQKVKLILDADTGNEMDDLYAIVRTFDTESFDLLGLISAHFNHAQLVTDSVWNSYPTKGKDAMISRSVPEGNFGKFSFFEATAVSPVTSDVQHKLTHSLIEFDLNQLPKSATIKRAILTLYYPQYDYADTIYPVTDTLAASSTEYLAVLQRVVSPWQELEVTWKTQPETTTKDQVFIPRIYYITDASCNCIVPPVSETVDVTQLLMPDASGIMHHGMLLNLVKEEYPDWLRFASSDFEMLNTSNQELVKRWPKLEIYYTLPI